MTTTSSSTRRFVLSAFAAVLIQGLAAEAPHVFAIRGAQIVPVAGPVVESGTVVIRGGVIDAVGVGVAVPPDATVIDGQGLTVYPGLIDMGTQAGIDVPAIAAPRDPRTRIDVERWKRQVLLRPDIEAARFIKADPADLKKLASFGITAVLAVPGGGAIAGMSAMLHAAIPDEEPQIGNIADARAGRYVVKTPALLHVRFPDSPPGEAYPDSLMGVIAFVRQAFLDAGYAQAERARGGKTGQPAPPPAYDPALDALVPALAGRIPVAFEAQEAHEIRRAIRFAREFKLDTVIVNGLEADQVIDDLKLQKVRVLLSVNYPARPKTLAPDADEPLRTLRQRAGAPSVAAALDKAGVPFAFASDGLQDPGDFLKNVGKAVKAGLPRDAALRALTLGAATIAGAADRLGSIERGKIASLVITQGDLFDDKVVIKHVFVGGRQVVLEPTPPGVKGRAGR